MTFAVMVALSFNLVTAVGAAADAQGRVYIEGSLTSEGVECVAFRSDEGELFTLLDIPAVYQPWRNFVGLRFLVVGTEVEISHCQQGRTLTIVEMALIWPPVLE